MARRCPRRMTIRDGEDLKTQKRRSRSHGALYAAATSFQLGGSCFPLAGLSAAINGFFFWPVPVCTLQYQSPCTSTGRAIYLIRATVQRRALQKPLAELTHQLRRSDRR